MKVENINIGLVIAHKLDELGLSKSEFGRRIGIPQQNVNRILDKSSIDTDKLISISEALDFNFFECFCADEKKESIANSGDYSIVLKGNNNKNVLTSTSDTAVLQERIKSLEAIVAEKERLIKVLMERK